MFWDTPVKGKTPKQKLEEVALKECTQTKAEQILALQFGLEEAMNFETFLKRFKQENDKRKQMLLRGEIVYGPSQYTLEQYYAYANSNRRKALCREITRRGLVEEEGIIRFYDAFKENLYKKPDTYQLQIHQVGQETNQECVKEIEINPENIRVYAKQYPKLMQNLKVIQEDEYMELQDSKGQVYVIHCRRKIANGYFEQAEVKDNIKDRLARSKRDHLVEEIVKEISNGDHFKVCKYENQRK